MEKSSCPSLPGSVGLCVCAARSVLLNELILRKIAKWLPSAHLLCLRTTTTAWNRAFIPILRRTHCPIDLRNSIDGDIRFAYLFHGTKLMQEYTETMRASQDIPFGHYEVSDLIADEHKDKFEEFFSVCGDTILSIKLSCFGYLLEGGNLDQIRRMIFALAPNLEGLDLNMGGWDPESPSKWTGQKESRIVGSLSHLKRLRLQWNGRNSTNVFHVQMELLLQDIILHATGLEHLELHMGTSDDNMPALIPLRDHAVHLDKLKSLSVMDVKVDELQILFDLTHRKRNGLRLKSLSTTILQRYSDLARTSEALYNFLASQSATLRHVDLFLDDSLISPDEVPRRACPTTLIRLPRMELNSLHLAGFGGFELEFEGGTLGQAFPKLSHLNLYWELVAGEFERSVVQVGQLAHPGVTDLTMTIWHEPFQWTMESETRVAELAGNLQAVTKCEIISECIPGWVWVSWPNLTILDLVIGIDTYWQDVASTSAALDEWLSGIPKSRFSALKAEHAYQLTKAQATTEEAGSPGEERWSGALKALRNIFATYKSQPGISDLLCLRQFTLIVKPSAQRALLCSPTDIGGYFGLAMASSTLQHLVVRCHKKEFLSVECILLIKYALWPSAVVELGDDGLAVP